jgi:site-specific DNA-cytosine methylase
MGNINILSLFDGLGGARIALDALGVPCAYYASEIDKHAIGRHMANYPGTIQVGDVTKLDTSTLPKIDLLIGGSPCQSLSGLVNLTNKTRGLDGKSKLFFEYFRILEECNPKYFVLENVASMKDVDRDVISDMLGVQPIMINSNLLTAQTRKRYYWTNIPNVTQPDDLGLTLQDTLQSGFTEREKAHCLTATYGNACVQNYFIKSERQHKFTYPVEKIGKTFHIMKPDGTHTIEITPSKGADYNRPALRDIKLYTSKLTPVECERLQGLPDNYTEGAPLIERYKMIGNGFTVPVIAHILKNMEL